MKHPKVKELDIKYGIDEVEPPTSNQSLQSECSKKLEQVGQLVELLFPGEIKANESCCIPAVKRLLCELSDKR